MQPWKKKPRIEDIECFDCHQPFKSCSRCGATFCPWHTGTSFQWMQSDADRRLDKDVCNDCLEVDYGKSLVADLETPPGETPYDGPLGIFEDYGDQDSQEES